MYVYEKLKWSLPPGGGGGWGGAAGSMQHPGIGRAQVKECGTWGSSLTVGVR